MPTQKKVTKKEQARQAKRLTKNFRAWWPQRNTDNIARYATRSMIRQLKLIRDRGMIEDLTGGGYIAR